MKMDQKSMICTYLSVRLSVALHWELLAAKLGDVKTDMFFFGVEYKNDDKHHTLLPVLPYAHKDLYVKK